VTTGAVMPPFAIVALPVEEVALEVIAAATAVTLMAVVAAMTLPVTTTV
jgi:hypothetical protein